VRASHLTSCSSLIHLPDAVARDRTLRWPRTF